MSKNFLSTKLIKVNENFCDTETMNTIKIFSDELLGQEEL